MTGRTKKCKNIKAQPNLHMAALKNAAEAFKLMSESYVEKSKVLKDDDAMFRFPGRQFNMIYEAF